MFESLVIYISLFIIMTISGYYMELDSHNDECEYSDDVLRFDTLPVWIFIISFTFVFGCRYMVGVDWPHYLDYYIHGSDKKIYEPLFGFITLFLSSSGFHYAVYFSVISFLEISFICIAFRKHTYLFKYLPFFIIIGFWFLSLCNIMRQQLAATLFLIAVGFIADKKPLQYYICAFLAILFHKSAIILVLVFPLFFKKDSYFNNTKYNLGIFCIAFAASYFVDLVNHYIEPFFTFFADKVDYSDTYSIGILTNKIDDRTQFGNNSGFGNIIQFVKFLPLVLYGNKMKDTFDQRFFNISYDFWFIGVISIFLFNHSITITRPFIYFQNFIHIIPAFFLYYDAKYGDDVTRAIAIIYYIIYAGLLYNLLSNGIVNTSAYSFFWEHKFLIKTHL